jgi:hypothetical protein
LFVEYWKKLRWEISLLPHRESVKSSIVPQIVGMVDLPINAIMDNSNSPTTVNTMNNAYARHYVNDVVVSPIRERTRNAIAQHRAWRQPDLRRTYAGISSSSNPQLQQSVSSPHKATGIKTSTATMPRTSRFSGASIPYDAAISIYEDIESSDQQQQQHSMRPQSIHEEQQFRDDSVLSSSIEGHLQQVENFFRSPTVGNSIPSPSDRPLQYQITDQEFHEISYRESAHHPGIVYDTKEGYDNNLHELESMRLQHELLKSPQLTLSQNTTRQQPVLYRDDESETTGMSQQELIRKKARNIRRKRLSSKPKKPIVQLPAQLLLPARISSPQRQPYHTIHNKSAIDMSKRYRWSKSRSLSKEQDDLPEMESLSATAETTNESGDSPIPLGSFAAAALSPSTSSRRPPVLAVRGDDTLIWVDPIDQRSLGEDSFPILSNQSRFDDSIDRDDDNIRVARHHPAERIPVNREPGFAASRMQVDVTPQQTRRGSVRFARTVSDAVDDESSMPWDQKKDVKGSASSPASVLENIDEDFAKPNRTTSDAAVPKSILRVSRYKPTPLVTSIRYSASENRSGRGETERLLYTVNDTSSSLLCRTNVGFEQGVQNTLGGQVEGLTTRSPSQNSLHFQEPKQALLNRELSPSRDLSPPRNRIGLVDSDGLELSPIRPSDDLEIQAVDSFRKGPVPYGAGPTTETQLRKTMATFLAMRDGEIADRVIEEEKFPDPPLEIDVSLVCVLFVVCICCEV